MAGMVCLASFLGAEFNNVRGVDRFARPLRPGTSMHHPDRRAHGPAIVPVGLDELPTLFSFVGYDLQVHADLFAGAEPVADDPTRNPNVAPLQPSLGAEPPPNAPAGVGRLTAVGAFQHHISGYAVEGEVPDQPVVLVGLFAVLVLVPVPAAQAHPSGDLLHPGNLGPVCRPGLGGRGPPDRRAARDRASGGGDPRRGSSTGGRIGGRAMATSPRAALADRAGARPPAIDGIAICRAIRHASGPEVSARSEATDPTGVPIVLVARPDHAEPGAEPSVTDWLIWPFSLSYACTKIRAWVLRTAARWQAARIPADEEARLAALSRLQILDTEPEARFDRIT